MITVPTIYTDNEAIVSSALTPPQRRQPVWLAWITALLYPQQWLNNLVFNKWYSGSNAPQWTTSTFYAYGADVVDVDYAVYECINPNGVTSTTRPHLDPANWMQILNTFVGVGERAMYTGQLAMLEYILNYYFSVGAVSLPWTRASQTTQIYIVNSPATYDDNFWMTQSSPDPFNSFMANKSAYQTQFMRQASSGLVSVNFTIYVPSAVASAITANQPLGITYINLLTAIVQKYAQPNYSFTITTY